MKDEYERKWSEAISRHNASRERGWTTNAEARRMSEEQRNNNLPAVISNGRRPSNRSMSGSRGIKIVGGNEPELKFDEVDAEFIGIYDEPIKPHISRKSQKKSSKKIIDAEYEVFEEPKSRVKSSRVKSSRVKSRQKSVVKSNRSVVKSESKESVKSKKGLIKKYVTKSNIRRVGKNVGVVAKAAGGVVGETAKAIGDANLAHAQAYAIRNGMYAPGEKTKRVYYYPDGTVKEVVETQKPGDVRKGGTADKKNLGPGNLGPKANAQAKGKPGPGRRQATLGKRQATIGKREATLGTTQHNIAKVQNGPVNNPKDGPTNNGRTKTLAHRSGYKPKPESNKPTPQVRSGYKPTGKRRSVHLGAPWKQKKE